MIRWNLVVFGTGLLILTGMVLGFVHSQDEVGEPAWLLIGTVVGGYIAYAMAVVQALTAPSDPAPTITEKTHLETIDKVSK